MEARASRRSPKRRQRTSARLARHHRQRESIIPLAADGLYGGGGQAAGAFGLCEPFEKKPCALHPCLVARRVGNLPLTDDVVGHQERAWPRQPQRPFQVAGIVLLVGVDEDQVEGGFCREDWQGFERRADTHVDLCGHFRAGKGSPAAMLSARVTSSTGSVGTRRSVRKRPTAIHWAAGSMGFDRGRAGR